MKDIPIHLQEPIQERLEVAKKLVLEAGAKALEIQRSGIFEVEQKSLGAGDIVTAGDRAVQQLVTEIWSEAFPQDFIKTEESNNAEQLSPKGNPFSIIVDEIDGTVGFRTGMPDWGVSIGIFYQDQPVAGVINFPGYQKLFQAVLGAGATCNNQALPINRAQRENLMLADSIVSFNYGYLRNRDDPKYSREEQEEKLELLIAEFFRRFGGYCLTVDVPVCCTLAMCQLAEGTGPASLLNTFLGLQDMAAAALIISEAGGVHSPIDWSLPRQPFMTSANPGLYNEFLERAGQDLLSRAGFK